MFRRALWIEKCCSKPVIPNRGAAAHLGSVTRCQEGRQLIQFLDLYTYLTIRGTAKHLQNLK